MTDARSPSVAVVGAGITGLALTHHLRERGADVETYEAAPEAGGVVRSRRFDDRIAELGPQRLRATPGLRELVDAAGLGDDLLTTDGGPLWIYRDGRLERVPLSLGAAVGTGLLSWRSKLRMLLEPLAAPPRPEESVAAALRRNFGREAADRLFAPLYAGLYGSDPTEMPAARSLCRALSTHGVGRSVLWQAVKHRLAGGDRPPIASIRGGLGRLTTRLAERYDEHVALSTPVVDLAPDGDRWRVVTRAGSRAVDDVVVTTPADVAADLLGDADPETAAALDELRYNPIAHVYLDADPDPTGIGYRVPRTTSLRTGGATFGPTLFGDDRSVAVSLSGADEPAVREASDAELGTIARREFETVTGSEAAVLGVHRWERGIPAYDRSFDALPRVDPPAGVHVAANYVDRAGVTGRIRQARTLAAALADGDRPHRSGT